MTLRPPELVLPSQAIPWGRWVEDSDAEQDAAIAALLSDSQSAGRVTNSTVTNLGAQIAGIVSVSAIYDREIAPRSVTRSGTSFNVYDSLPTVFNPPEANRPYDVTVIANINATSTFPLDYAFTLMRVNGQQFQFRTDNRTTGTAGNRSATLSAIAGVRITPNDIVTVEFGLAASAQGRVDFSTCQVTAIFSGSIPS